MFCMTNFFVPKARRRTGRVVDLKVPILENTGCPKKWLPFEVKCAACSSLNALELRIAMHALRINLRILGLIRELKHSNSSMRHWRLTSKSSLSFFGHLVLRGELNRQI